MFPDWFGVHAYGVADCPVDTPTDGIMSLGIVPITQQGLSPRSEVTHTFHLNVAEATLVIVR